ncbi:50S ribosomal protein L33, partial [Coemansia spiralis]
VAKKAKSRNILVRLISSAGTGFIYVKQRPRLAAYRLTMMKFDPVVNKHVLFTEHKMK